MHLVPAAMNNYLIPKILVTIILIANAPDSVLSWSNVKKLTVSNEASCITACTDDHQCSKWSYYPTSEIVPLDGSIDSLCFLESKQAADPQKSLPPYSSPSGTPDKTTGLKRLSGNRGFIGVQNLLAGPLEFDSTTVLNFPQHFVRGCSYTILVWVWMWRPRLVNSRIGQNRKESIIFSARGLDHDHSSPEYESWLPSVIYNVPSKPGKLFFSANRDEYGDYSGFSPAYDIRYHEWTHITMTITDDRVGAYINGKFISSSRATTSKNRNSGKCPYSIDDSTDKIRDNIEDTKNSSKNQRNKLSPNSIMDVIGRYDRLSDPGMMQDLTVVRGLAISEVHIQELMNAGKPSIPPTMKKLMKLYDIYTLEGYSELKWFDNYYRMMEWGLCPTQVCGPICLTDRFLLGLSGVNSSRDSDNNKTNYEDFDDLVEDFYQSEYENQNENESGNELNRFDSTDDNQNFNSNLKKDFLLDGDGDSMGGEDDFMGYDDYYDENGLLKPLTLEQQEVLRSYGYDIHDDYYGDGDGVGDGMGGGDGLDDDYYGDRRGVRGLGLGGGGGGVGVGGLGGTGGERRVGGGRGDVYGDEQDTNFIQRDLRQIGRRDTLNGNGNGIKIKNPSRSNGNKDSADPGNNKKSHSNKIFVKKSVLLKLSKNDIRDQEKENSTYTARTKIILPRRHSFKKMSMVTNNNKKINTKKSPVPMGHPGWVFSEQFGFMDHITPAAIMKYLNNAYKNFAPIKDDIKNKEKVIVESEGVSEGEEEKNNIAEMELISIQKLLALDEKEEAYLLYHPVGTVLATSAFIYHSSFLSLTYSHHSCLINDIMQSIPVALHHFRSLHSLKYFPYLFVTEISSC